MGGFAVALSLVAFTVSAEERPSIHLVLSDGHGQLQGQSERVVRGVIAIFRDMGIDVTWSSDPSLPSSSPNVVTVAVLDHSSQDWRIGKGAMAATLRTASDSKGSIFLFFPDIARAMHFRLARTSSIRDGRPPGVSWDVGVARIISHEVLHYYLPGRPHDSGGIFMEHQRGDLLLSRNFEVSPQTREALLETLRSRTQTSLPTSHGEDRRSAARDAQVGTEEIVRHNAHFGRVVEDVKNVSENFDPALTPKGEDLRDSKVEKGLRGESPRAAGLGVYCQQSLRKTYVCQSPRLAREVLEVRRHRGLGHAEFQRLPSRGTCECGRC